MNVSSVFCSLLERELSRSRVLGTVGGRALRLHDKCLIVCLEGKKIILIFFTSTSYHRHFHFAVLRRGSLIPGIPITFDFLDSIRMVGCNFSSVVMFWDKASLKVFLLLRVPHWICASPPVKIRSTDHRIQWITYEVLFIVQHKHYSVLCLSLWWWLIVVTSSIQDALQTSLVTFLREMVYRRCNTKVSESNTSATQ